jgi:hypothetical protein
MVREQIKKKKSSIGSDEELGAKANVSNWKNERYVNNVLNPTSSMHFHLLHFVGIKFLFYPLGQGRRKSAPCRWFAPAVIYRCCESVVNREVARKC